LNPVSAQTSTNQSKFKQLIRKPRFQW